MDRFYLEELQPHGPDDPFSPGSIPRDSATEHARMTQVGTTKAPRGRACRIPPWPAGRTRYRSIRLRVIDPHGLLGVICTVRYGQQGSGKDLQFLEDAVAITGCMCLKR